MFPEKKQHHPKGRSGNTPLPKRKREKTSTTQKGRRKKNRPTHKEMWKAAPHQEKGSKAALPNRRDESSTTPQKDGTTTSPKGCVV